MSVILGIMVSRDYLVDGESEKLWVWVYGGVIAGAGRTNLQKPVRVDGFFSTNANHAEKTQAVHF